ncbi:flowering time control protein FPA-like [Cynara cardunculus var. scolymus]|uniref:flowering time control protein FPA-like n=1 Tax=Cynara cardunculus var. scolymus TaxID=59895 RepID=UPI000D624041|nr:flowering time control protein FPA-like [Cynara cardunculus var. scolymus]XP_024971556.1 flowering time control protein FPA-like [Cynara cardunculus var. scolymus]
MGPPMKSNRQGFGTANVTGKQNLFDSSSDAMFNNLWVGNLSADVTDSDLRILFEKHGAVDSVTCYPSRSYAFVNMNRTEDAKKAKESLQGVVLRGSPLKIDFAKPAKPCKSLWVSGISITTSKEDLEAEFSKFGTIEDFKFLRDKNTAYIDYSRLEDASKALKMMNGKKRGGSLIRVDYLRSQSKRDQGPDFRDAKEGQHFRSVVPLDSPWLPPDTVNNYSDPSYFGTQRQQHNLPLEGRKGDGEQPSNVLVISYPPVVHIDEQMLHNAMILFGEIDNIRSFPSRHYSLVEFRSVEEAQLAKDGLQGRLFNDPRISIMFSSSEHAPTKDLTGFHPGVNGPRPHTIFNELPTQAPQLDVYSHPVLVPNSLHGRAPPYGGPDISIRPFAPPDSFDPLHQGPEFNVPGPNPINPMGVPNWRRSSPTPGMLSSSSSGVNPPTRPSPGTWDVFDASQLHREPKRLRTDGNIPIRDMKDQVLGTDPVYSSVPQVKGVGRLDTRLTTRGTDVGHPNSDYIWRGVIAKGGTPVCHARCVPIRDWIGYEIPEVVNCSARTGLDMLAKHYIDAVGFDIVFFLPDSEEDFASYTEFVRYLGDRNRAGVAKFDDGTTLFLVPPSEFLSKVLNVSGPERLYGVVLKFPQHASGSTSAGPLSNQPQYIDKQQVPSQNEYNLMPSGEKVLQIDYTGAPHDDSKSLPKSPAPPSRNPLTPPPMSTSMPQTGLSLTPELIATLASLAKGKFNNQQPSATPPVGSVLTSAAPNERPIRGWEYEPEPSNLSGHFSQAENSFYPQPQIPPQHQGYQSNMVNDHHSAASGNYPVQDLAFSFPQREPVPSMMNSTSQTPQSGHFVGQMQANNQQYLPNFAQDTHAGYAFEQKTDVPSVLPPGNNLALSQVYGGNVYQPQSMVPTPPEKSNLQLPEQMQQLQSALYAATQQPSDFDADKNERYQSTLQFATNLLLQIHQQQPGTQSGQGGGSHQGGSLH